MIWNSFIAGIAFLLAGSCGLVRHFLLEPKIANYPQAPRWLLRVFFFFSAVLLWSGGRFLLAWWLEEPSPPRAQPTTAFFAVSVLIYKGALLVNTLRQRLPAHLWRRLNRINHIVRCSPRRS